MADAYRSAIANEVQDYADTVAKAGELDDVSVEGAEEGATTRAQCQTLS